MYKKEDMEGFHIVGLSVVTTNENGAAAKDLGELWSRFYSDNVPRQIPNMVGSEIYSIYTDYESNHEGLYTCIIGVRVDSLNQVPEGLTGRSFPESTFVKLTAKGPMPDAIFHKWQEIWAADSILGRSYEYDFEVYGEKSMWGDDAEVDIYLSVTL